MDDNKLYERLGRLVVALDKECERHAKSMELIKALKDGSVTLERVHMTPTGWILDPMQEETSEP